VSEDVVAQDAYKVIVQITVQPVQSVKTDGGDVYASEMFGRRTERAFLTAAGEAEGCEESRATTDDLRVVRIDPPPGETVNETGGGVGE
jgi:hypothetical protein